MTTTATPIVPTVGEIARQLGVPLHKVEYVIRARGIGPAGRAGNARIFTQADIDRIGAELRRIEAEREGMLTVGAADRYPDSGVARGHGVHP